MVNRDVRRGKKCLQGVEEIIDGLITLYISLSFAIDQVESLKAIKLLARVYKIPHYSFL